MRLNKRDGETSSTPNSGARRSRCGKRQRCTAGVFGEVRSAPFPYSKYILYYQIEVEQILVVAVQHERANPKAWQRRV